MRRWNLVVILVLRTEKPWFPFSEVTFNCNLLEGVVLTA